MSYLKDIHGFGLVIARVCGRDCSVHTRHYTSGQIEIKLSTGYSIGYQGMHHYSFFLSVFPTQLKQNPTAVILRLGLSLSFMG